MLESRRMLLRSLPFMLLGLCALPVAGCREGSIASFDPDSIPDAYSEPTGALMTPRSTRAWEVTRSGDLYNGAWVLRVLPMAGSDSASSPRRIAAEDRWIPVLHWVRRSGTVRWVFSATAANAPAPRDTQLMASLEIRAVNAGDTPVEARLILALEPRIDHPPFVAWDGTPEPPRWGGHVGPDPVHAWCEGAGPGQVLTQRWTLTPGE